MDDDPAPIVVAGEALYDLVVDADGAVAGTPGGGPYNTARTIGRLRRPVAFLGRLSRDALGVEHARLLEAHGVDDGCVVRSSDATTLAFASLDAGGAASYEFRTAGTASAGLTADEALAALPARVAALHVGTLGLVLEPLATAVEAVVRRLAGRTLIAVDPNVRPPAIDDEAAYRERLQRVLVGADLVKVSTEDLAWLDPGRTPSQAARALLGQGPRAVLLTRGADGATALTADGETQIAPVAVAVVDTIGAGDAFGGGFLAWWASRGLGAADLETHELVADGARFAAAVSARTVARAGASPPQLPAAAADRPLDAALLAQAQAQ